MGEVFEPAHTMLYNAADNARSMLFEAVAEEPKFKYWVRDAAKNLARMKILEARLSCAVGFTTDNDGTHDDDIRSIMAERDAGNGDEVETAEQLLAMARVPGGLSSSVLEDLEIFFRGLTLEAETYFAVTTAEHADNASARDNFAFAMAEYTVAAQRLERFSRLRTFTPRRARSCPPSVKSRL